MNKKRVGMLAAVVLSVAVASACLAVVLDVQPASARSASAQLSVTELETPPGGTGSGALDINDRGQVVGYGGSHAFLWEDGQMTDLGTLGGYSSIAYGINSRGQVAGYSSTASGGEHAFLWEDGEMTDLGTMRAGYISVAYGINRLGQVVGESYSKTSSDFHALLWTK
jgi:probable HAF family extracellular repeat protein